MMAVGIRGGLVALAATVALTGCTLFPEPDPVQTYRFGASQNAPLSAPGAASAPVAVSLRPVEFVEASRNDRLLGVIGNETSYIAGARWVSRAQDLYEESLRGAFGEQPGQVQLLSRREPGTAPLALQVHVTTFEARYTARDMAPNIVVTVHAVLSERGARAPGEPMRPEALRRNDRTFTVVVPATANRVSAIVDAFDQGTQDVNRQIVAWVAADGR